MPIIFSSDFENIVSPFGWTGVNISGINTVAINGDHPFSGVGNLYCTLKAGSVAGSFAGVYKSYLGTGHDHIFMRAMNVIVDQLPTSESQRLPVHGCWQSPSSLAIGICGFTKVGGILKWFNYYRHNGAFVMQAGGTPQLNTPYCVEMEILQSSVGNADGAQRVWIDGVLTLEITGLSNSDRLINYLDFGLNNAEANATIDTHFWGDDFVASDQYIGPATGVLPKLTIASSPEINVPVYIDGTFIGNTPITVSIPSGTHTVRVESEVTR